MCINQQRNQQELAVIEKFVRPQKQFTANEILKLIFCLNYSTTHYYSTKGVLANFAELKQRLEPSENYFLCQRQKILPETNVSILIAVKFSLKYLTKRKRRSK